MVADPLQVLARVIELRRRYATLRPTPGGRRSVRRAAQSSAWGRRLSRTIVHISRRYRSRSSDRPRFLNGAAPGAWEGNHRSRNQRREYAIPKALVSSLFLEKESTANEKRECVRCKKGHSTATSHLTRTVLSVAECTAASGLGFNASFLVHAGDIFRVCSISQTPPNLRLAIDIGSFECPSV